MAATLMQLRRLTRARLGVPVSDDFFTDNVLDDHINLAVQAIDSDYRWPWSEVIEKTDITPTAPDIVLPAGWRATRAIFDGETELHLVAPSDLMSWSNTTGAPPRVWCPMTGSIMVRPSTQTDRSLTHHWYRQSVWLMHDEDRPDIPDQFAGAIVAKAAELLSQREGDRAGAGNHNSDYTAWLNRMRRDVRRSTQPTRIRVRPGGWI